MKITKLTAAAPGIAYPLLLSAAGRCPPEDVGGPWGYEEMLSALSDPAHGRHTEFVEWHGLEFNPNSADSDRLDQAVAEIAKLMTPRKLRKRKSREA